MEQQIQSVIGWVFLKALIKPNQSFQDDYFSATISSLPKIIQTVPKKPNFYLIGVNLG